MNGSSVFETCSGQLGTGLTNSSIAEMMSCISNGLEASLAEVKSMSDPSFNATYGRYDEKLMGDTTRSVFLVFASAMIFFMQAGFAMVCAGAVRKKNVQNTMLKNLLDACGASFAFFCVGFAFAFGGMDRNSPTKTFIGTTNFFLYGVEDLAFWLFHYAFSAASATIVAGALAERCQMTAYLCYSVMLTGWVYPVVAHSVWCPNGFLSAYNVKPLWNTGMVDISGSGVVHITGGVTALFAAMILGPRRGRFHDDEGQELEVPREFPGSSVALQMLGTFILWFGWYGFNTGSTYSNSLTESTSREAALAAVNTTLGAGMGGLSSLIINLWWQERTTGEALFDLQYAMNGVISGLVAITAGCSVVEPWAAILIGFLAGVNYNIGTRVLLRFRIDDAVNAVPVHLFNGVLGVISIGFVASPTRLLSAFGRNDHAGLFYTGDFVLLGAQLVGMFFILSWTSVIMAPFFIWLDFMGWFRSDPLEEIVGLDTSYHGGLAMLLVPNKHEHISDEHLTEFRRKRSEAREARLSVFNNSHHRSSSAFLETLGADHSNDLRESKGTNLDRLSEIEDQLEEEKASNDGSK